MQIVSFLGKIRKISSISCLQNFLHTVVKIKVVKIKDLFYYTELDMCPKYKNAPVLWSLPIRQQQLDNNYFPNAQSNPLYILTPSPTPGQDPGTTLA